MKVLYSAKRNNYRILLGEVGGRVERGCEVQDAMEHLLKYILTQYFTIFFICLLVCTSLANIWIWSPSCITAGSPRIHSRRSGGSRIGFDAESKTHGFGPGSHSSSGPAGEFELDNLSLFGSKEPKLLAIVPTSKLKYKLSAVISLSYLNSLASLSHNCGLVTQSFSYQ